MSEHVDLARQIAEVSREIDMRVRVFPTWVAQAKYTQAEADERLAAMKGALATLKWVEKHRARLIELAPELDDGR
jgi:hypothetical protein